MDTDTDQNGVGELCLKPYSVRHLATTGLSKRVWTAEYDTIQNIYISLCIQAALRALFKRPVESIGPCCCTWTWSSLLEWISRFFQPCLSSASCSAEGQPPTRPQRTVPVLDVASGRAPYPVHLWRGRQALVAHLRLLRWGSSLQTVLAGCRCRWLPVRLEYCSLYIQ